VVRCLVIGSMVAAAIGFGVAVVLAASGCDTGPLYPDMMAMETHDLAPPTTPADLDPPPPPPPDLASLTDQAMPSPDAALPGRVLVWHDEFDGAQGQAPDPNNWTFDTGCSGWGNQQLECTTNRPQNVSLDGNGHLAITAIAESYMNHNYTSGRIETLPHFTHAFGRFEARMQMPSGQGLWPAFWLLGDNVGSAGWPGCGEIDIVESKGQEPNTVHGTVHGPGYSGANGITSAQTAPGLPLSADFHTYAVEWIANQIVFSVDNVTYFKVTPASLPPNTQWVFAHPFGVLLDVAVGGTFVGSPDSSTTFPQTMLVDYVRVYEPLP
jgi:beta-glucanase (GH16 family)